MRYVKRNGDSKADFFIPPAMEKVAIIMAGHQSKSIVVSIKAELAATALREQLENDVCDAGSWPLTLCWVL